MSTTEENHKQHTGRTELAAQARPASTHAIAATASEFEENERPRKGLALPELFNPDKTRERARAWLAGALTALLATVVVILVVGVVGQSYPTAEAIDLLGVLLSPLVALVGAATGFYYGGKNK